MIIDILNSDVCMATITLNFTRPQTDILNGVCLLNDEV